MISRAKSKPTALAIIQGRDASRRPGGSWSGWSGGSVVMALPAKRSRRSRPTNN